MSMRIRKLAALTGAIALLASSPAAAVGGPNSAGKSGHFHPNSSPCASDNNHPHCPGPH
jgi:hypothetical protein